MYEGAATAAIVGHRLRVVRDEQSGPVVRLVEPSELRAPAARRWRDRPVVGGQRRLRRRDEEAVETDGCGLGVDLGHLECRLAGDRIGLAGYQHIDATAG